MTNSPQFFCDGCGSEILSSHAYKHKGKIYCTKHCLLEALKIQFVRLEG